MEYPGGMTDGGHRLAGGEQEFLMLLLVMTTGLEKARYFRSDTSRQ